MRALALLSTALLTGCYLSHERATPADAGFEAPDAAPLACTIDADCDDGNPCTDDRCLASSCRRSPRPMHLSAVVPVNGSAWDVTTHRGEAIAAVTDAEVIDLRRFGPDGDRGSLGTIPIVEGTRPWDNAIASIGGDLAIVQNENAEQLVLRMLSQPSSVERTAGSYYVELMSTGDVLAATTDDFEACHIAWATPDGHWIEDARDLLPCARSDGSPASRQPALIGPSELRFWALDPEGHLTETRATPGLHRSHDLVLDQPGPGAFASFVPLEHAGVLTAMWTRSVDASTREVHVAQLSLDGDRASISRVSTTLADETPYAFRMALERCSERSLAVHTSAAQLWIQQLDDSLSAIAEPLVIDDAFPDAGNRKIACFTGGAIVTTYAQVYVLSCEP